MGLLVVGTPLAWHDSKQHIDAVKHKGITQFLALYDRLKQLKHQPLLWGDEVSSFLLSGSDRDLSSLHHLRLVFELTGSGHMLAVDDRGISGNGQIEYIIVSFQDDQKEALLALSQTEILVKLAAVVMDMESKCSASYVPPLDSTGPDPAARKLIPPRFLPILVRAETSLRLSIPSSDVTCSSRHQECPTISLSLVC
jgi:glutamate--cysteine ligase catalytic subunit